jgi:hypothetical protein
MGFKIIKFNAVAPTKLVEHTGSTLLDDVQTWREFSGQIGEDAHDRKGQPTARGGKFLCFMEGEGGRGRQHEVEKNFSTLYPNFESRPPLRHTGGKSAQAVLYTMVLRDSTVRYRTVLRPYTGFDGRTPLIPVERRLKHKKLLQIS